MTHTSSNLAAENLLLLVLNHHLLELVSISIALGQYGVQMYQPNFREDDLFSIVCFRP